MNQIYGFTLATVLQSVPARGVKYSKVKIFFVIAAFFTIGFSLFSNYLNNQERNGISDQIKYDGQHNKTQV